MVNKINKHWQQHIDIAYFTSREKHWKNGEGTKRKER